MDQTTALKNLKDITEILQLMDCEYWLEAGTCLGAYREHGFIAHDNDTDIGVLQRDFLDIRAVVDLFYRLMSKGFNIYHTFGKLEKGFEIAVMRDLVKTDIFFFYEKGDKLWHGAWKNGGRNGDSDLIKLVFNKADILPLGQIDFLGSLFYVPGNIEAYLVARYGDDWAVPNKKWDWSSSPKCIDHDFEI